MGSRCLSGSRLERLSTGRNFQLKESRVDYHNQCLRLSDTKTGQEVRPIGTAALSLLEAVPHIEGSEYVFPASRGKGHLRDVKLFHRASEIAGIKDITLHSLRHGFESVAGALGYADATIGVLLGHVSNTISGRYTDIPDRAALSAADRISETILKRIQIEINQSMAKQSPP